ncbi:hypothetical protein [Ramlibacter sp.]|uniref:hypothetical protein n=1 Tax=Ramlibacter sp. TaxID=1917967 RepID=UPI002C07E770|nr:hypothetical protein [Ramlibacter sp.]HWI83166.1 hypothetical protein [Ramlibacter sp.]
MRAIFGVVGLLLVVLIVGSLARKQLTGGPAPATAAAPGAAAVPAGTPRQQVQQFQQAVQQSMQAPRPEPDAK